MKLSNIETNRLKIYADSQDQMEKFIAMQTIDVLKAAETEKSNIASQKVLKKAGFVPTGEIGDEGPRYEKRN